MRAARIGTAPPKPTHPRAYRDKVAMLVEGARPDPTINPLASRTETRELVNAYKDLKMAIVKHAGPAPQAHQCEEAMEVIEILKMRSRSTRSTCTGLCKSIKRCLVLNQSRAPQGRGESNSQSRHFPFEIWRSREFRGLCA